MNSMKRAMKKYMITFLFICQMFTTCTSNKNMSHVCMIGDSVFRRSLEMHADREHISRLCAANQYCLTFKYKHTKVYFGHILGLSSLPPHIHYEKFIPLDDPKGRNLGKDWEWPLKAFEQHLSLQKEIHGIPCQATRVLSNAWDCQQHRLKHNRGNITAQTLWLSRYLEGIKEVAKLRSGLGIVTMHRPSSVDTMCSLGLNVFARKAVKMYNLEIFDWERECFDADDTDVLADPLHLTSVYAKKLLDMILPKATYV